MSMFEPRPRGLNVACMTSLVLCHFLKLNILDTCSQLGCSECYPSAIGVLNLDPEHEKQQIRDKKNEDCFEGDPLMQGQVSPHLHPFFPEHS